MFLCLMKTLSGIYDVVCNNPDVAIAVLDMLWEHFKSFYVEDAEVLPPLHFSKVTNVSSTEATLKVSNNFVSNTKKN